MIEMVQWTKEHFETIAKILGESIRYEGLREPSDLIIRFSVFFQSVNPNFDKIKFEGRIWAIADYRYKE